jgi:hypothetical protein
MTIYDNSESGSDNEEGDGLTMMEKEQRDREKRRKRFLVVCHQDGGIKKSVEIANNIEARRNYDKAAQHVLATLRRLMQKNRFTFQIHWCGTLAAAAATVFDVSSQYFLYR